LRKFAFDRDWDKYHTPKNLAMAITSEAGELADLFQWLTPDESRTLMSDPEQAASVRMEIADLLQYVIRLADVLGVDLVEALEEVLERNVRRFPAPSPPVQ
jgi:NTP pyrophosphatase (non-canonical NTP hydrolase)